VTRNQTRTDTARSRYRIAVRFVVLIGVLSLFADLTYEGARAINGSYLAVLGATAAAVGVISGAGELAGYLIRWVSGTLAHHTRRYWLWTAVGYVINLFAAPALALTSNWPAAAALIIAERIGKGFRNPPRDVMLSHAGSVIGQGWAFALREALDQLGAMAGPLMVAGILLARPGDFHLAYAWLLIPAVVSLLVLTVARLTFPRPHELEQPTTRRPTPAPSTGRLPRAFWRYLAAMALMAAGYADFNLLSFHLQKSGQHTGVIPLLYTLAMGTAGLSALIFGRWFDHSGVRALAVATVLAALFAPLTFLGNLATAAIGVALWGIGMGIQDSLMNAPLAEMIHPDQRARAFGLFSALYGIAWFAGSTLLGILYDHSLTAVVAFSVITQAAAAALLATTRRPRQTTVA
jgi:hypothetical protein